MKRKLNILGTVLAVALIFTGCGNDLSAYQTNVEKGYTLQTLDKVRFMANSTYLKGERIYEVTDSIGDNKPYVLYNDTMYEAFQLNKYMLNVAKLDIESGTSMQDVLDAYESETGIRITGCDNIVQDKNSVSGTNKVVASCNVQALLSTNVFADYEGYVSILTVGDECYVQTSAVADEKLEKDLNPSYSPQTMFYIPYDTKVNSNELDTTIDYASKLQISDVNEVGVDTYGYVGVTNKSENVEQVKIAAKVTEFTSGEEAESQINDGIEDTIYKELPQPDKNKEWQTASIEYSYLGYKMETVPPSIPIKVTQGDTTSAVYTLTDNKQEGTMTVFFQINPEKEYTLCLGNKDAQLYIKGGGI